MSPKLHSLNRATTPNAEAEKPSRDEVEAALRTIIRWTGEDPDATA